MHLAFCESSIVQAWVGHRLAERTHRPLKPEILDNNRPISDMLRYLSDEGVIPACTVSAAAHVVTGLYKRDPPFSGDAGGFMEKKSYAREAAEILYQTMELLSPTSDHFRHAESLWFRLCDKGNKMASGEFRHYVDAALILRPPEGLEIRHVLVNHSHLKYVLLKQGFDHQVHQF